MIVIDYMDGVNRPQQVTFDNYNSFVQSQQSCWHDIPDFFKVTRVNFNGHDIPYQGLYGDVYHFLMKQDLTQYQ
ncbi:DUF4649 family protein [Streptococcus thoraltensis]|uniref:DUF4649 family protein n=1 Tax=Streptococcus thoraltensis TaxID=55085 RepID=UPI00036D150A|nr:DUF4649 family protein [Streptococcus thoraltensis]MDY4762158.1 DUF4649 family protein [Streptococcus thoraltensis]